MDNSLLKIQSLEQYSGPQLIFKSDRIILNGSNDIIISSKNVIALGSNTEIHINSKNNLYLNSKDGKIILGKSTDPNRMGDQNSVLGNNLYKFLDDIIQLLITFQVTTPSGEGTAGPKVNNAIKKIKKKYFDPKSTNYILSDIVYIANNKK